MEYFLNIFYFFYLLANMFIFVKIYIGIQHTENQCNLILDYQHDLTSLIKEKSFDRDQIIEIVQFSLLSIKDEITPTTPIKPNNWDSVREAFKRPTRNIINERD